jgi:Putative inner membrane protein (DUF1819)
MPTLDNPTRWRATGSYLLRLASKTSLIDEMRQFLLTYARLGTVGATRQALIDGGLPQRSRVTRATILEIVQIRLTRWHPPAWVLDDLIAFAQHDDPDQLRIALLLHTARQDELLYDIIQQIVVPRWSSGERALIRADVQRFLDDAQSAHPEVSGWSSTTRERLSSHALAAMRDFGLLQGKATKEIVEPLVPPAVAQHLVRLLEAESIPAEEQARHTDWHLWLWDATRAQMAIDAHHLKERVV